MNTFDTQPQQPQFTARIESSACWVKDPFPGLFPETCGQSYVALQALFTPERRVFGYEVLHRSGWDNCFQGDADHATQAIMKNWTFQELHGLAGGHPIFLNCPRQALVDRLLEHLAAPVVIEVLETVEPDEEVLAACRRLKALGYQIALDDFQLSGRIGRLVELADYIKVDFRLSNREERAQIRVYLDDRPVALIAEKIETAEEFETAIQEGFQLFQGYYTARPVIFSKCPKHMSDCTQIPDTGYPVDSGGHYL